MTNVKEAQAIIQVQLDGTYAPKSLTRPTIQEVQKGNTLDMRVKKPISILAKLMRLGKEIGQPIQFFRNHFFRFGDVKTPVSQTTLDGQRAELGKRKNRQIQHLIIQLLIKQF